MKLTFAKNERDVLLLLLLLLLLLFAFAAMFVAFVFIKTSQDRDREVRIHEDLKKMQNVGSPPITISEKPRDPEHDKSNRVAQGGGESKGGVDLSWKGASDARSISLRDQMIEACGISFDHGVGFLRELPPGRNSHAAFRAGVFLLSEIDALKTFEILSVLTEFPESWTAPVLMGLAEKLAETDPRNILYYVNKTSEIKDASKTRIIGCILRRWMQTDIESVWMELRKDGKAASQLANAAFGENTVLDALLVSDKYSVNELILSNLGGENYIRLVETAAASYARVDPQGGKVWLDTVNDDSYRLAARRFGREWIKNDVGAALLWIDQVEDKALRDLLVEDSLVEVAEWDLASANSWAKSVSDPEMRVRLLDKLEKN